MLKIYNTLSKTSEDLKPADGRVVRLYTCGPTVYNFAHIGNLRTYIFEDLLKRSMQFDGYEVRHVMNITDVGHLVGDGDEGEDKIDVGARREGKHPLEIARFYESSFFADLAELNILPPDVVSRATETVEDQIEIIKILEEKGFTYKDQSAVYFDTSKFKDYGRLSGQKLEEKKVGAREEVVVDSGKKHPADFALWFFLEGRYKNHILRWPSPWGEGFPGWHIECSAISRKFLGQPFDIHCGGVDHIGTHHANEIAQSEAAFGLPLAHIWMHGEFLQVNSSKMAKSAGTFITLAMLKEKGFSPLDYRYLCLTAHYRTQLNFTWENLLAAHNALKRLVSQVEVLEKGNGASADPFYSKSFAEALQNELNIPEALAVLWKLLDDPNITQAAKKTTVLEFDKVLGLGLGRPAGEDVKIDSGLKMRIDQLLAERESARVGKDFARADLIRKEIEELGYEVLDTPAGQKIKKKIIL